MFANKPYRYSHTRLAFVVGVLIFVITHTLDVKVFELFVDFLNRHAHWQIAELAGIALLIGVAAGMDVLQRSRRRLQGIEQERHQHAGMKATLGAVNDIVLGFLDRLHRFRQSAQTKASFPSESLSSLDDMISETATKLRKIGEQVKDTITPSENGVVEHTSVPLHEKETTPAEAWITIESLEATPRARDKRNVYDLIPR